jgi:tRNA threonylcarbamoyladenosine biosynthesis protein TsaE
VAELALDELASAGVLVVEWPERAEAELPPEHLRVSLQYGSGNERAIAIEARGSRYSGIVSRVMPRTPAR